MFFDEVIPAAPLTFSRLPSVYSSQWDIPGSKIITNRALVLAALADGTTTLKGFLDSDDTRHVRRALEALGVVFENIDDTTLVVRGGRQRLQCPAGPIYVGNSASAMRFMTAVACLVDGNVTLDGDASLRERPLLDLVEGLRELGVDIECFNGRPPITIHGKGRLHGGHMRIRADRSSQFLSAVLLAGGLASEDIEIELQGPMVGKGYVELTSQMVAAFGGQIEQKGNILRVKAVGSYRPCTYVVEPDACSASYAFALAAGSGAVISVPRLGSCSVQSDARFVDILELAGAHVQREIDATTVTGTGHLRGVDVDMRDMPDCVATWAALAPLAEGPTVIRNVGDLRVKSFDRLEAIATALASLGQDVVADGNDLYITPRPLVHATIATQGDHQLGMSFAVLGALRGGVTIDAPRCIAKSYPRFWLDLGRYYQAAGVEQL